MKMIVNVDLNLDVEKVTKEVLDANRKAMRDTVVAIHRKATSLSPKITGYNMRSLASEVSGMGVVASGGEGGAERVVDESKIEGAVYSSSGYGGYIEVGTKPHIITVKNAKVLSDGTSIFGKTVHHPGTNPHPYLKPALDMNFTQGKFAERVKRHLK